MKCYRSVRLAAGVLWQPLLASSRVRILFRTADRPPYGDYICTAHTSNAVESARYFRQHRKSDVAVQHFCRRGGDDGGGAWGRIRTTDTRIFSPLLYQLSYPGPEAARPFDRRNSREGRL